jgi:aminoglycoside phosphotransferase (APT) family kinase protein
MYPISPGALIGQGRTAEIFAWQEHQILKLFFAGFSPEAAEFEMMKSRVISSMNLPTPKFIDMVEIDERKGLIYERVDGISMLKMINTRPWLLFRLARQLAELHTAIHQLDGTGLPSIRPQLNAAIQQVTSINKGLASEVLQQLQGLPDGQALCHFDFHPDQVLMTARGLVILDWATAHQGHPLADIAQTTVLLKVGQVPYGGRIMHAIINLWRKLFLETYLSRYFELHPGLSRAALTPWLIPAAAGRLSEGIAGEREQLLPLIEASLAALEPIASHL